MEEITPQQFIMARHGLGLTQQAFAEKAKLGLNTIIRFEKGESSPSKSTLKLICLTLSSLGATWQDDEQTTTVSVPISV